MADLPAITLNGIAHRFGRRWAIRGVSLSVAPGEILAIIGHNGSGKSTLLRVAATAIRPTRGQASVFGADVVKDAQSVRAMVALLSTDPGVYGDLTALENLRFAARMLGTSSAPAVLQRALDRVGLGREGDERARNMSSGMQRRLSIAQGNVPQPRRADDAAALGGDEGQAFGRQAVLAQPFRRLAVAGLAEGVVEQVVVVQPEAVGAADLEVVDDDDLLQREGHALAQLVGARGLGRLGRFLRIDRSLF